MTNFLEQVLLLLKWEHCYVCSRSRRQLTARQTSCLATLDTGASARLNLLQVSALHLNTAPDFHHVMWQQGECLLTIPDQFPVSQQYPHTPVCFLQ